MRVPEFALNLFKNLITQLASILPQSARPSKTGGAIPTKSMDKTDDIALSQYYYDLIFALEPILTGIKDCSSSGLKPYLARQLLPSLFSDTLYTYWNFLETRLEQKSGVVGPYSYYAATAVFLSITQLLKIEEKDDPDHLFQSGSVLYNALNYVANKIYENMEAIDIEALFKDSEANPFVLQGEASTLTSDISSLNRELSNKWDADETYIDSTWKQYHELNSKFETLQVKTETIPVQSLLMKVNGNLVIQPISLKNKAVKSSNDIPQNLAKIKAKIERCANEVHVKKIFNEKIKLIEEKTAQMTMCSVVDVNLYQQALQLRHELSALNFLENQLLPYPNNQHLSALANSQKECNRQITEKKPIVQKWIDEQENLLRTELAKNLKDQIPDQSLVVEKIKELETAFTNRENVPSHYSNLVQKYQAWIDALKPNNLLDQSLNALKIDRNDPLLKPFVDNFIESDSYKQCVTTIENALAPLQKLIQEQTTQIQLVDENAVKKLNDKIAELESQIRQTKEAKLEKNALKTELEEKNVSLTLLKIEPIAIDLDASNWKIAVEKTLEEIDKTTKLLVSDEKILIGKKTPKKQSLTADTPTKKNQTDKPTYSGPVDFFKSLLSSDKTDLTPKKDNLSSQHKKIPRNLESDESIVLEESIAENQKKQKICIELKNFFTSWSEKINQAEEKHTRAVGEKIKGLQSELVFTTQQRDFAQMNADLQPQQKIIETLTKDLHAIAILELPFPKDDRSFFQASKAYEKLEIVEIEKIRSQLAKWHVAYMAVNQALINQALTRGLTKLDQIKTQLNITHENVIALQKVSETIQLTLNDLIHKKEQALKNYQEKKSKLATKRQQLAHNANEANVYHNILVTIDKIVGKVNSADAQAQTHQYTNNVINQLVNGTFHNPNYILNEDQFYTDLQQQIHLLKTELNAFKVDCVDDTVPPELIDKFNQEKNQKIAMAEAKLVALEVTYADRHDAWVTFGQGNLIEHSRIVTNAGGVVGHYNNYDLRGIHLTDKNYQGSTFNGANFSHAILTRVNFRECHLAGANLSHATLTSECDFYGTNFRGVIVNQHTNLAWGLCGHILFDNLTDTSQTAQSDYLVNLVDWVAAKCDDTHKIHVVWLLEILNVINAVQKPNDKEDKIHLIWQKQMAVMVMQKLVPKLELDQVLGLVALIDTKHDEDANPFAFIRREQGPLHAAYGNTHTWEIIVEGIKNRLNALTETVKLQGDDLESALKIMKTHTTHDYFFGWAYTPQKAKDWEARNAAIVTLEQKNQI